MVLAGGVQMEHYNTCLAGAEEGPCEVVVATSLRSHCCLAFCRCTVFWDGYRTTAKGQSKRSRPP